MKGKVGKLSNTLVNEIGTLTINARKHSRPATPDSNIAIGKLGEAVKLAVAARSLICDAEDLLNQDPRYVEKTQSDEDKTA